MLGRGKQARPRPRDGRRTPRTRHQMLGDHAEGTLEKVEVERHLLLETTKGSKRAAADARAAGFTWEQITQRLPGLASTHEPHAAERLFEMVSVAARVWANAMPGGAALTVMASCATMARTAGILSMPSLGTGGIVKASLRRSLPRRPVWKPMISRQLASRGPSPTTMAASRFALNRSSSKAEVGTVKREFHHTKQELRHVAVHCDEKD